MPTFTVAELHADKLIDKTLAINAFPGVETSFINIDVKDTFPSAWKDYPLKYKFVGFQINLSDSSTHIHRSTFDLFNLLTAFGGVYRGMILVISPLVASLAYKNKISILANRFYTETKPIEDRNELE